MATAALGSIALVLVVCWWYVGLLLCCCCVGGLRRCRFRGAVTIEPPLRPAPSGLVLTAGRFAYETCNCPLSEMGRRGDGETEMGRRGDGETETHVHANQHEVSSSAAYTTRRVTVATACWWQRAKKRLKMSPPKMMSKFILCAHSTCTHTNIITSAVRPAQPVMQPRYVCPGCGRAWVAAAGRRLGPSGEGCGVSPPNHGARRWE